MIKPTVITDNLKNSDDSGDEEKPHSALYNKLTKEESKHIKTFAKFEPETSKIFFLT